MPKEGRFSTDYQDKGLRISGTKIIVDTKTGVQYLFAWDGYSGGMSVLVDQNGKPLVDENYTKK